MAVINRLSTTHIAAGIVLEVVQANFKVDVWAGGVACITRCADDVALVNNLARDDIDAAEMTIKRLIAITMIHHDQVTVAKNIESGISHSPCIRRKNG